MAETKAESAPPGVEEYPGWVITIVTAIDMARRRSVEYGVVGIGPEGDELVECVENNPDQRLVEIEQFSVADSDLAMQSLRWVRLDSRHE